MGIIVSCFKGCGREYLKNTHGDKIKIFDAIEEFKLEDEKLTLTDEFLEGYVNKVMDEVINNDIVFIHHLKKIRNVFNKRSIDYDVFYPSEDRRGEFIENQVRKRANPKIIMELDKKFEKWVSEIDNDESENCFKHKLSNKGEFIGNTQVIMQYVDSLAK